MRLFDLFKRGRKKEQTKHTGSFDRAEWHFESAADAYCKLNGKTHDELTDDDYDEIYFYAGNHIGFFIAWLIKHGFEGEVDVEGVKEVREERISGTQYHLDYCDGKFISVDCCEEILDFVCDYYENEYMSDYSRWVIDELHDLPYEFVGTWEEYHAFEPVIDRAYERYLSNRGEKK